MPKNPSNLPEPRAVAAIAAIAAVAAVAAVANDEEIAAELETLRRELLWHTRRTHKNANAEEDLVVFRFVRGMTQAKWTALTSRPDLAGLDRYAFVRGRL